MTSTATIEQWLKKLHQHGYRPTATRQAVVAIIIEATQTLTAQQVYDLGRLRHPALGLVTVYRTLDMLEQLGLVERVHQPHGCHAYIASTAEHQHLLLCQNCGRAERFSGDNLEPLFALVAQQSGYLICEHWLQLLGICPRCQVQA